MSTFKITNTTHLIGKRDGKYNSTLEIEYVDNMLKKTIKIKPSDTVYLTLQSLPVSAHSLRVKNLVTISEVSEAELATVVQSLTPKPEVKAKPKKNDDDESKFSKKNIVKKEREEA